MADVNVSIPYEAGQRTKLHDPILIEPHSFSLQFQSPTKRGNELNDLSVDHDDGKGVDRVSIPYEAGQRTKPDQWWGVYSVLRGE